MHIILCLLLLFVSCLNLNLLQWANASSEPQSVKLAESDASSSAHAHAHGGKKKVLIVAPNTNPSHYQFHKKLALIAMEELENIEVCILIMERGNAEKTLINGKRKPIRAMTNSEHQEVEDKELAKLIGPSLKVMYFDGQSLRTAAHGHSPGTTLPNRRTKSSDSATRRSKSSDSGKRRAKSSDSGKRRASSDSAKTSLNPSITSQKSSKRGRSRTRKNIGSYGAGAASDSPSSSHPKTRTKRGSPPATQGKKLLNNGSPSRNSHNTGGASSSLAGLKLRNKANSESSNSRSKSPTVQGRKSDFSSMWRERDHDALRRGNDPKAFFSLVRKAAFMQVLENEHFTIGIAEVFEAGAFYIFEMLGIEKIVATSTMPSQSVFYSWLGEDFLKQIIAKEIPGMRKCVRK